MAGMRADGGTINRYVSASYWIIVGAGDGGTEPYTWSAGRGETLPVFGFEDEALMYLWCEGLAGGWRVRESSAGELISLLFTLCSHVTRVALDPLPKTLDGNKPRALTPGRFVDRLATAPDPRFWSGTL